MILYVFERQWRQALAGVQVNLHFSSGMQALFTVTGAGQKGFEQTGVTRTYYIQVRIICSSRHLAWLEDPRQLSCQFLVACTCSVRYLGLGAGTLATRSGYVNIIPLVRDHGSSAMLAFENEIRLGPQISRLVAQQ